MRKHAEMSFDLRFLHSLMIIDSRRFSTKRVLCASWLLMATGLGACMHLAVSEELHRRNPNLEVGLVQERTDPHLPILIAWL